LLHQRILAGSSALSDRSVESGQHVRRQRKSCLHCSGHGDSMVAQLTTYISNHSVGNHRYHELGVVRSTDVQMHHALGTGLIANRELTQQWVAAERRVTLDVQAEDVASTKKCC